MQVQQKLFDDLVGKWGCAARAQPVRYGLLAGIEAP